MNYKEMLDKFDYLERQVAHLENEIKHARERLAKLEYTQQYAIKDPGFTPGTLPQYAPHIGLNPHWVITCKDNTQGMEFK